MSSKQDPGPSPSRAVFGFALYLACRCTFGIYLIWAFVPDYYLHECGLTIFPQKYWALALPVHLCVTLALFAFLIYPGLNMTLSPNWSSVHSYKDCYSLPSKDSSYRFYTDNLSPIPTVADLDIRDVCKTLFLNNFNEFERPRKINRSQHS